MASSAPFRLSILTIFFLVPSLAYAVSPWEQNARELETLGKFRALFEQPKSGPPPRITDEKLAALAKDFGDKKLQSSTYAALIELMQNGTSERYAKVRRQAADVVLNGSLNGWLNEEHVLKLLKLTPKLETKSAINEASVAVAQSAHRRVERASQGFNDAVVSTLEKLPLLDRSGASNPAMNLAAENLLTALDRESLHDNPVLTARLRAWVDMNPKERLRYVLAAGDSRLLETLGVPFPMMSNAEIGTIAERSLEVKKNIIYGTKSLDVEKMKSYGLTAEHEITAIMTRMYAANSAAALKVVDEVSKEATKIHARNVHAALFAKLRAALDSLESFHSPAHRDAVLKLLDAATGIDYDFEREAISHLIDGYSADPIVQRKLMGHLGSEHESVRALSRRALSEAVMAASERDELRVALDGVTLRPGDDDATLAKLRRKAEMIGPALETQRAFPKKVSGAAVSKAALPANTACVIDFALFAKMKPNPSND